MFNKKLSFRQAEKLGRMIFSQLLMASGATNIEFMEDDYDNVDVYWGYDDIDNVGELKYRQDYSSNCRIILEEGAVLEKPKYDKLISRAHREGKVPYYIMMFNDGAAYSFDLTNYKPTWVEEVNKYPKTTCGNNKKVTKVVTYIPLDFAKDVIRYNIHYN